MQLYYFICLQRLRNTDPLLTLSHLCKFRITLLVWLSSSTGITLLGKAKELGYINTKFSNRLNLLRLNPVEGRLGISVLPYCGIGNHRLQVGNWSAGPLWHTGRRNTGIFQQAHSHKTTEKCRVRNHSSTGLSSSQFSRIAPHEITEVQETEKISCVSRQHIWLSIFHVLWSHWNAKFERWGGCKEYFPNNLCK